MDNKSNKCWHLEKEKKNSFKNPTETNYKEEREDPQLIHLEMKGDVTTSSNEIQKVIWESFASLYSKEIGKPKRNKASLDCGTYQS